MAAQEQTCCSAAAAATPSAAATETTGCSVATAPTTSEAKTAPTLRPAAVGLTRAPPRRVRPAKRESLLVTPPGRSGAAAPSPRAHARGLQAEAAGPAEAAAEAGARSSS